MAMEKQHVLALNRGIVSALGLSRVDLTRMAYSAEIQRNILPRTLGSAMLRPGWEYLGNTASNAESKVLPFVFSVDDTASLMISANVLRVWVDDVLITRPAVTADVGDGDFSALTSWTDIDESGTTSALAGGDLSLLGDGLNYAGRKQQVTVNETGVEHALEILIARGPVLFKAGSTDGGDEYIAETLLEKGHHSLSFTPSGNFWIYFRSNYDYSVLVESVEIASAGPMHVQFPVGSGFLKFIRSAQSNDVIYVAAGGFYAGHKIQRRGVRSWSAVRFMPSAGPFRTINVSNISIAASAISGDITLTASKPLFKPEHSALGLFGGDAGALFRIASNGQTVSAAISAADSFTDPIRVTGIGDARRVNISITGTFVGTVTVQYSVGEPGAWVDLTTTYTAPVVTSIADGLDNQIIYYRIGIKTGNYTSGTATCTLSNAAGTISGIAMVTSYVSPTQVTAVVLRHLGGTAASTDWWEGAWSDYRHWPSTVQLHEGRLWWMGLNIDGSISDVYEDFDDDFEGNAGPISRNIGFGPTERILWALSLNQLAMGTALNSADVDAAVISGNSPVVARSSSDEEPMTPTNFNLRTSSPTGLFVDRSGQRLYALEYDGAEYKPSDLSITTPDLNSAGILKIAVQMKPDVRIHCVRADGLVSVLVFDRAENVAAWVEVETDGIVEDVSVLPGTSDDQVYYVVKRTINAATVRFFEKWALESECQGGTLNKQADAFIEYSGSSTTTIGGLSHLEGETVTVWGDGKDLGTYVVAGGVVSGLSESVTSAIVGLTYRGRFKGVKLASMFEGGLSKRRRLAGMALQLINTHYQGLRYGPSFDVMYDLPATANNVQLAADTIHSEYDHDVFAYGGDWSADSRLHLEMNAPRPGTITGIVLVTDG